MVRRLPSEQKINTTHLSIAKMNLPFYIAKRYLFSKKSTQAINIISLISIIGVCVGSAALFIILSVFNGFEELNLKYYKQLNPDVKIQLSNESDFNYADVQKFLTSYETKAKVVRVYENHAMLKYLQTPYYSKIKGVSEDFLKIKNLDESLSAGDFKFKDEYTEYMVMGTGIAYQLGIDVTQTIQSVSVFAPKPESKINMLDPSAALNRVELYPAGLFSVKQDMDQNTCYVSLSKAEELFQTNGAINAVELYLNDEKEMKNIKSELTKVLPSKFIIKDRFELNEMLYKVLNTERWGVYLILTFILTVAISNIVGAITMLIIDKKKDIAILHTLGLSNEQIRKVYLIQGLLISFIGLIIGLLIGTVFVYLQEQYGLIKISGSEEFLIQAYPIKLVYTDYLLVLITVLVLSFLASLFSSSQINILAKETNQNLNNA